MGRSPAISPSPSSRLAVALDLSDLAAAVELAGALQHHAGWFKVGKQLFVAHGPEAVREVGRFGKVFLDLKFHDIPNTVARAVSSAAGLGIHMLTLHAASGTSALAAAVESARGSAREKHHASPLLLGVTVLTSLTDDEAAEVGLVTPIEELVIKRARVCMSNGLDGLVCSPQEVKELRRILGSRPLLVTPGIRPEGTAAGDQSRIATPREAVAAGADILVVGRAITSSNDPVSAARAVLDEIEEGMNCS